MAKIIGSFLLLLACWATAFCPPRTSVYKRQYTHLYTAVNNKTLELPSNSNFWIARRQKDNDDPDILPPFQTGEWPVVPTLDNDGILPPACYNVFGCEDFQAKPTCALAIAINLLGSKPEDSLDLDVIIEYMQQCVDHGLTTFHLGLPLNPSNNKKNSWERDDSLWLPPSAQPWGEANLFGLFQKSTPGSVMNKCNLVVPLQLPTAETDFSLVSQRSVRKAITNSLGRIGTDAIDTLEVQYTPKSPYHFDVMDHLAELQREGLIRSISGKDFPTTTLRALDGCGYHLDSHRRSFHMISNDNNLAEYQLTATDLNTPNVFSSPLAGGLLSDQFEGRRFPPSASQLGDLRHRRFTKTLKQWATNVKDNEEEGSDSDETMTYPLAWARYQKSLLPTLRHMALKHRVSISAVALRWILQTKQTGGTVIGFDMAKYAEEDNACLSKIKSIRNTFRLELDEEDLESIDALSGRRVDPADGQEELDLNNPKLWL